LTVDVIGIIHLGLDVHRLVNIDQEQWTRSYSNYVYGRATICYFI
jgi:hypothetical protein